MDHIVRFTALLDADLGRPLGQARCAPLHLGAHAIPALLVAYGEDREIDPSSSMFFYPRGTLALAAVAADGQVLWRRDLGRGVVPGVWFCPVLPCDLDGDGVDEVWYVDNADPVHPLNAGAYHLTRLDGRCGEVTGSWPWPQLDEWMPMFASYRNFILAGRSGGETVLVTAQGTYGQLRLQGWKRDLSPRWTWERTRGGPGGSGSHMAAVVDLDGDGRDVVVYGEHLIDIGSGRERLTLDGDAWRGHSDINLPLRDRKAGAWSIYTCRENQDPQGGPRVAAFAADGRRTWGTLDHGHIDQGWVAHLPGFATPTAWALRIGAKSRGPEGTERQGREEFAFCALTGAPRSLPMPVYGTVPVDHDGDGHHALVRAFGPQAGAVIDATGAVLGSLGGAVALVGRLLDHPGEQIVTFHDDGHLRVWADTQAVDRPAALARYRDPYYGTALRLGGVGYHLPLLGGL